MPKMSKESFDVSFTRHYQSIYRKSENPSLVGYADADWAGRIVDTKSTSGYLFTTNGTAVTGNQENKAR